MKELTKEEKEEALAHIKQVLIRRGENRVDLRFALCVIFENWLLSRKHIDISSFELPQEHVIRNKFPELANLKKIRTTPHDDPYWFNNESERLKALESIKL